MSYFGLCIGGPLDGQYRSWNTKRFETPAKSPEPSGPVGPSDCDQASLTVSVTHYDHSPWRAPGTDKTFDLWLHKGLSVAEALAILQDGYGKSRHGTSGTLRSLKDAAHKLRNAQKAYMLCRGDDRLGQQVALAANELDEVLSQID